MEKIRFAILTVSDRCSRGEAEDKSGQELHNYISGKQSNGLPILRKCVPDDVTEIKTVLIYWCDSGEVDVILSTGGTGFSPRDVTPEATKSIIEKEAPGLVIAMMQGSLSITPLAMLSRPACGVRKRTIIINLPGSSKGSMENFKFVEGPLVHAVNVLRNELNLVDNQHKLLTAVKTKVNAVNIADRDRKSAYECVPLQSAQNIVIGECSVPVKTSIMNLRDGLGYILAENIFAKDALPPFQASTKDGYAVKVAENVDLLNVLGDSTAGDNPEKCAVREGFCVRISTGAPVPSGADAVVQIEDTILVEKTSDGNDEKVIRVLKQPVIGQDIRPIGSDIKSGENIVSEGTKLGAVELGLMATVGVHEFLVYNRPTIAILSTGNELQNPQEKLEKGKIRDSNKTTLEALLRKEGFRTVDIGVAKDTPQDVLDKVRQGLTVADILVSTGGVSMGERDYLKRVLKTDLNATIHIGNVLMKPGKPTTFATCMFNSEKKFIFGLPGNPVSATVSSHLFLIPACRKRSGSSNPFYTKIKAKVEKRMQLDTTRPEYHRVTLVWSTDDGIPIARSTGNQISSRLLSCTGADALLELPQGSNKEVIEEGSVVNAVLLGML